MFKVGDDVSFKVGDKVKFKKSSIDTGMIDATQDDVFTVHESYKRAVTLKELQGCYHVTHFEHVKEEIVDNTEKQEIKWEVGQEVFCLLRGKGVVHQIYNTGVYWSEGVDVCFMNHGIIRYKFDGTISTGFNRSLFFSEPEIIAEKFPPKKPFTPVFYKGDTLVAKKKDGKNTVVFYVDKETEISVESTGCGYPKTLYNFYKISEEVKFS